jgi:hypothetical protein
MPNHAAVPESKRRGRMSLLSLSERWLTAEITQNTITSIVSLEVAAWKWLTAEITQDTITSIVSLERVPGETS